MRDLQALSILDAALNLTTPDALAVRGIARAAAALVQRGTIVAWCVDERGEPVPGAVCFERADQPYMERFFEWQRALPPAIRQRIAALSPRAIHAPDPPYPEDQRAMIHDPFTVCILANAGDGAGVHLAFSDPEMMTRPVHPVFDALACHLASAWRVRRGLQCAHRDLASTGALDWKVAGATPREVLRHAVARDLGRARPRSTDELELWNALLDGQWSLLDAF
jgi:hypothetical protein